MDGRTTPSWPWNGVWVTLVPPGWPWNVVKVATRKFKLLSSFHDAKPQRKFTYRYVMSTLSQTIFGKKGEIQRLYALKRVLNCLILKITKFAAAAACVAVGDVSILVYPGCFLPDAGCHCHMKDPVYNPHERRNWFVAVDLISRFMAAHPATKQQ